MKFRSHDYSDMIFQCALSYKGYVVCALHIPVNPTYISFSKRVLLDVLTCEGQTRCVSLEGKEAFFLTKGLVNGFVELFCCHWQSKVRQTTPSTNSQTIWHKV